MQKRKHLFWAGIAASIIIVSIFFQNCSGGMSTVSGSASSLSSNSANSDPTGAATVPTTPPSVPVVTPPPSQGTNVPGVSNQALLSKLLNYAQTWKRNWNFGGHAVDNRFTEQYGFWDYTETTYEPWLFDRATVGYKLFQLTGDQQWRTQAESDLAWYSDRIGGDGVFTPKGQSDTKYGYVTPFALRGRANLSSQQIAAAQRIYDSWIGDFPSIGNPTGSDANLWTEREIGLALDAAVGFFELNGSSAALTRAQALVDQWQTFADLHGGAPLVTYTRHEGGGPGGTTPQDLITSPWMSALYFQAARRYIAANPASTQQIYRQVSNYFDWLDNNGGFYDGAVVDAQYAGIIFPAYLAGSNIGDGGPSEAHMAHAIDVAGMVAFAILAKENLGLSISRAQIRLSQMRITAGLELDSAERATVYLPRYRISPPRKFNWQLRGIAELFAINK